VTGSVNELQHFVANAAWLLLLRWVAVFGQLVTIGIAAGLFQVPLPWISLVTLVGLTAASNLALAAWVRGLSRYSGANHDPDRASRLLGLVMAFDILSLTGLLYFAGGVANPFSIFYLVNLTLCAVILSEPWGWVLTGISVAGMTLLLIWHVEMPDLTVRLTWPEVGRLTRTTLGQLGQVVAMAACALVIIHFVARVTGQLELTAAELQRVERERSRSEKLEALGTLAGGAAHELATPLSTIAVVATEMMRHLRDVDVPDSVRDDLGLIRTELAHCQAILRRMTAGAGQSMAEQTVTTSLRQLLDHTIGELSQPARVSTQVPDRADTVMLHVPLESLAQALRGLLQNAIDATTRDQAVQLTAHWTDRQITLTIRDEGPGMSADVLARAGEPFFSTKEPGRGMGLGLFLTRSVIERLGGRMELASTPGAGVTVVVELPR
jgi:two-component system sensor histidine kinase RegB